jgi:glycosyltransferase involved in cell wall biosynthesis
MKTSVILPAYNEEKNIGKVLKAVKAAGRYEIIVVDDGSTDATGDIARKHGCKVLRFDRNIGKGYACRAGAKIASHENLVFMDSDGQLNGREIPKMLKQLRHSGLVVGTRTPETIPVQRRLSNRFAKKMVSVAAGRKMGDVLCGFRAIRRKDFMRLRLEKKRYEIEAEMILKAAAIGMKINEVPVSVKYGVGSSITIPDTAKVTTYIIGAAAGRVI